MASLSTKAVEIIGRNWLVARLLANGFQVATPEVDAGIDLIIFAEVGEGGIHALPLQLKCATAKSFSLDRKYEGRGMPLVYVWDVLDSPVAYIMTFAEALEILGPRSSSPSYAERGLYAITSPSIDLRRDIEKYRDRWHWLREQLNRQPESGESKSQSRASSGT